jgi:MFS family permease
MSTPQATLLDAPVGPNPRPRFGWILGLTSTAYFMVVLDALVVVTALPRMQQDLHVGIPTLQWTVNGYGISVAAGIITAAALGDRLGRRRIFVWGVALFTLASAACALAPSASLLIAARAVQGLGGAAILPLSLTILTTAFPAERRGMIVGIYGGLAGLAVAAGPLVGGAVTQGLDWHWIFWINVPLGFAATPLSLRLLPESYGPPARLDFAGVALVSGAAVAIVWGLVRATVSGGEAPRSCRRSRSAPLCSPRLSTGRAERPSRWFRCGCSRSGRSRPATPPHS